MTADLNGAGDSDLGPEQQSAWTPALSNPRLARLKRLCATKRQGTMLTFGAALLLCVIAVLSRTGVQRSMALQPYPFPPVTYPRKHLTMAPECAAAHTDGVEGCLLVRQACVDQGEVMVMGEEYIPDITHPVWAPGAIKPLPEYSAQHGMPYIMQYGNTASNGDFTGPSVQQMPPVTFRARSNVEPTPDLQHPEYDNGTIPVIFHPTYMYNHGHVLMSSMTWIYNNLNQSDDAELAQSARLVVRTPHGWDMPPFMRPLFQPLLQQPITTLAELSARPQRRAKPRRPRCFCNVLFCSSYGHTAAPNVWHAAQAVAASHTTQQQRQQLQAAADIGVRNVVFHTRSVAVRQFANQADLLERCSQWAPDAWGGVRPANCSTHIFTDVPSSVAAAQAADIFVAIHGANVPNAFYMRPGSALIEVMHPDWAHRHNWLLEQDPTHELIYFGLVVKASNWTPGLYEQQEKDASMRPYNGNSAGRDRNVHLKWEWLEPVLDRIASLRGNMTLYREINPEDRVMNIG